MGSLRWLLGALVVTCLCQGCASVVERMDLNSGHRPAHSAGYFVGSRADMRDMASGLAAPFGASPSGDKTPPASVLMVPVCLVDLPLSLVADLLWIPGDAVFLRDLEARQRTGGTRGEPSAVDGSRLGSIDVE
jgi:uncharacterized protein YceK